MYGFVSLSPMAQQYVSFPPLNLKQPKNVFPSQFPNTELVAFHSALSLPTFMGLVSLGPMSQQYVSFTPLNLKHSKYVLPLQYPNTVLVSFPSASWLPKFKVSFPSAPWANNIWVSLPSTFNTQNMYFPLPLIPKRCIGFISLSFMTSKIYGFCFSRPYVPTICEFHSPQP